MEGKEANASSPAKRTRWDEGAPAAGISLADLTAALAPLTGGVLDMKKRMTDMETQFAPKVDKTLDFRHDSGT